MRASMSASHHMLSAPEAPAPTAIAMSDAQASTGCRWPCATTMPTSAVNTTSDMTRGLSRVTKSPASAVETAGLATGAVPALSAMPSAHHRHVDRSLAKPRPRRGLRIHGYAQWSEPVMRGKVLNWWKGGGDDSVHSSVVAPSPHGLSAACCLRAKAVKMP